MTEKYLEVINEAPVLNSPNFKEVFGGNNGFLQTDEKGHIRTLEFIALKGTIFKIVNQTTFPYIYQVELEAYKNTNIFIDSRFTKEISYKDPNNISCHFNEEELKNKLTTLLGTKYLWGGNWSRGVEKLIEYYPPRKKLTNIELNKWMLKGVDCSGYLFEVTNGYTPRNTNKLIEFKNSVEIEGLSCSGISKIVKPLDLIVYKGHLIIVLDSQFTIESREKLGVIKTPIIERLEELFVSKKPANECKTSNDFVIRRWMNI